MVSQWRTQPEDFSLCSYYFHKCYREVWRERQIQKTKLQHQTLISFWPIHFFCPPPIKSWICRYSQWPMTYKVVVVVGSLYLKDQSLCSVLYGRYLVSGLFPLFSAMAFNYFFLLNNSRHVAISEMFFPLHCLLILLCCLEKKNNNREAGNYASIELFLHTRKGSKSINCHHDDCQVRVFVTQRMS